MVITRKVTREITFAVHHQTVPLNTNMLTLTWQPSKFSQCQLRMNSPHNQEVLIREAKTVKFTAEQIKSEYIFKIYYEGKVTF